jgi:hypothetical protein
VVILLSRQLCAAGLCPRRARKRQNHWASCHWASCIAVSVGRQLQSQLGAKSRFGISGFNSSRLSTFVSGNIVNVTMMPNTPAIAGILSSQEPIAPEPI